MKRVIEFDEDKWRNMMQLGEFTDECAFLNFALNLTRWYLTHRSDDWNIIAEKDGEIKTPILRGI
jgi:hypothetical protein